MSKLIDNFGQLDVIEKKKDIFVELIDTIISQQLAVKAASTISKRFWNTFGELTPDQLSKISDEEFREQGISKQKAGYIRGISEAVNKNIIHLQMFDELDDSEVREELIKLKGIGQWSADMFLMFTLGREDIFAIGDLGLRTAMSKLYDVERDDLVAIEEISLNWCPYRSYASRYLWKSLDNEPK